MKLPSLFPKFVITATAFLALSACNRAQYAALPEGPAYHNLAHSRSTALPPVAATVAEEPASQLTVAAATTPTTRRVENAQAIMYQKVSASAPKTEVKALVSADPTAIAATGPGAKTSRLQRALATKIQHRLAKISAVSHDNTAAATRSGISGNLRTGLILLLIGLLVGAIISGPVGSIIALIGVVFIVLWLLDEL